VARNQFGAYEQVTKIAPRHTRHTIKKFKKTKITSGHVNCTNTERIGVDGPIPNIEPQSSNVRFGPKAVILPNSNC
jgi:hypothetical protein